MFEVKHIGSAGQTVKTVTAKDGDHANRRAAQIKATFKTGSSEQIKIQKIR